MIVIIIIIITIIYYNCFIFMLLYPL